MRNYNSSRLLFDTDVVLDAVCPERPQSKEACEVLRLCNGEGDMGIVAVGSLKDAYYILCRQYGEPCARTSIEKLTELLVIAPTSAEECELSLHGNEPDFEDGLIRACAELNDVDFILTRDARAFARSRVRAVTCAEYLKIRGC
ncbi:type II toxin-antitoxin system VapC family toxin [Thermophilibacter provencensis]|uniref:type II toxin-antitoxin system VapC family toxin n=1 Tax=Thermophilibacter provencensis TaxID=1852386 RepID=UPI003AA9BC2C